MPFPMKVQPIDSSTYRESIKNDHTVKPVLRSRLKRFFDRPFPSVLRSSFAAEKPMSAGFSAVGAPPDDGAAAVAEFEPSSVCLDKMVQNFIEENSEKQQQSAAKFGRKCNCFNGSTNDSSDDEFDSDSVTNSSFGDSSDILKSLIPCATVAERSLLADISKIVETNKSCKRKDVLRKIITDELLAFGYNARICNSIWEKTSSIPAGEYEYIDVIMEGERVIIEVDFRSEFEIARTTGNYRVVLQLLPFIFVGKPDRLQQIISIVSKAARQSLKKKGMHIAPWRKPEYMIAKWLSPYTTITPSPPAGLAEEADTVGVGQQVTSEKSSGEKEMVMMTWQPPAVKPNRCDRGNKVVATGLASLLGEKL